MDHFQQEPLDLSVKNAEERPSSSSSNDHLEAMYPLASIRSSSASPNNKFEVIYPLAAVGSTPTDLILQVRPIPSIGTYQEYRERYLSTLPKNNARNNENMRRASQANGENHDPLYRERRNKNNEAAKRSRDSRREKELELAVRASFLQNVHTHMSAELDILKSKFQQLTDVRNALYGQKQR